MFLVFLYKFAKVYIFIQDMCDMLDQVYTANLDRNIFSGSGVQGKLKDWLVNWVT